MADRPIGPFAGYQTVECSPGVPVSAKPDRYQPGSETGMML
jgi:hypothetical protein